MYINLPTNKIESFQYFPLFWEYVSALNSKLLVLKDDFIRYIVQLHVTRPCVYINHSDIGKFVRAKRSENKK